MSLEVFQEGSQVFEEEGSKSEPSEGNITQEQLPAWLKESKAFKTLEKFLNLKKTPQNTQRLLCFGSKAEEFSKLAIKEILSLKQRKRKDIQILQEVALVKFQEFFLLKFKKNVRAENLIKTADNFKEDLCIFTTNYSCDIANLFQNEINSLTTKEYNCQNVQELKNSQGNNNQNEDTEQQQQQLKKQEEEKIQVIDEGNEEIFHTPCKKQKIQKDQPPLNLLQPSNQQQQQQQKIQEQQQINSQEQQLQVNNSCQHEQNIDKTDKGIRVMENDQNLTNIKLSPASNQFDQFRQPNFNLREFGINNQENEQDMILKDIQLLIISNIDKYKDISNIFQFYKTNPKYTKFIFEQEKYINFVIKNEMKSINPNEKKEIDQVEQNEILGSKSLNKEKSLKKSVNKDKPIYNGQGRTSNSHNKLLKAIKQSD